MRQQGAKKEPLSRPIDASEQAVLVARKVEQQSIAYLVGGGKGLAQS